MVTGVEVDSNALRICLENLETTEMLDFVELVHMDVFQYGLQMKRHLKKTGEKFFDTVVMNPPFGTKKKGLDMKFLRTAVEMANVVYSLHKTSTREFVVNTTEKWGYKVDVIAELRY